MAKSNQLVDVSTAKTFIEANWPNDPLLKQIAFNLLNKLPRVDAVEVVHSSWSLNDDGSGTCKHCHRTTKSCWDFDNQMNYCPNCGADMR